MKTTLILILCLPQIIGVGRRAVMASCGNGYAHCVTLTTTVAPTAGLTDFPNYLYGTYSQFATVANGGYVNNTVAVNGLTVPADLTFNSAEGCNSPLSWEWDSWNATTGAFGAWVKMSRTTGTDRIYVCVGKVSVVAYQCTASATWSAYKTVMLTPDGSALSLTDSSGNVTPTQPASAVTATTGQIDGAASFSGAANSYVQLAANGTGVYNSQAATIEAWIKTPAAWGANADYRVLFSYDFTSHNSPYYGLHVRTSSGDAPGVGKLFFGWNDSSTLQGLVSDAALSVNTWYHIAAVYASGRQEIWGNGVQLATAGTRTDTITFYAQAAWIERANFANPGKALVIDNFRFAASALSQAWIAHEYAQQAQASAWYSVGVWR